MADTVFSVTGLNSYIKDMLDSDALLAHVWVRGEISNYKIYPSGHHYFSIKDSESALKCVMFKGSTRTLRFRPENGMKVICCGKAGVYVRDGNYQLNVTQMTPDGAGELAIAFNQLKERLDKEGLFDRSLKKPLPGYPGTVAVVTSSAGAAVRDIIRVLRKRYPAAKVKILPVAVQGATAGAEIASAIRYANKYNVADVIICGRGGGSMEDLWCFNDERVARAIVASQIPVISAVGHEPDFTIADFVADVRAATPSNGAELAVPDRTEIETLLNGYSAKLDKHISGILNRAGAKLDLLASAGPMRDPVNMVNDRRLLIDKYTARLESLASDLVKVNVSKYYSLAGKLDALSPLKVLSRGFAAVTDSAGKIIPKAADLCAGDEVILKFSDGCAPAVISSGVTLEGDKNG